MNFDLNILLGILGLILTIGFGILGIYYVKRKKYPGSISYIEDYSTGLFNSLIKNFSEISITYDGQNISQQIAFVKGYLLNDGIIDISNQMTEQPITVHLPENFKWLRAKIIDKSNENLSSLKIINHRTIQFNLELFRIDEYLAFEALAEVPETDDKKSAGQILSRNITFNHRIANTTKINRRKIDLSFSKSRKKLLSSSLTILMAIGIFLTMVYSNKFISDKQLLYVIKDIKTNKQVHVTVNFKNDSTINLLKENGEIYKSVSLNDANKLISKIVIAETPEDKTSKILEYINYVLFIGIIFSGIIFYIKRYNEFKMSKKIRKIIQNDE